MNVRNFCCGILLRLWLRRSSVFWSARSKSSADSISSSTRMLLLAFWVTKRSYHCFKSMAKPWTTLYDREKNEKNDLFTVKNWSNIYSRARKGWPLAFYLFLVFSISGILGFWDYGLRGRIQCGYKLQSHERSAIESHQYKYSIFRRRQPGLIRRERFSEGSCLKYDTRLPILLFECNLIRLLTPHDRFVCPLVRSRGCFLGVHRKGRFSSTAASADPKY